MAPFNNNLTVETLVTKPSTPIFNNRFWQETTISTGLTISCSSVAVRRMGLIPDKVFVAYISEDTLIVKSAIIVYPIQDMVWIVETTILNCISCSLEFDGVFEREEKNIEYFTDEVPWLFYITTGGALMAGILGEESIVLVSSNVLSLDVVRGIADEYKDVDQGLIVFYIYSGAIKYQQLISGVWQGEESVDLAPIDAILIKVERLFDFRICLHVTDSSGALWEVFTKMAASGWNGNENLTTHMAMTLEVLEITYYEFQNNENLTTLLGAIIQTLYALSPVMLSAENYGDINNDFGFMIRLRLDELVFETIGNEYQFTLTDIYNTVWHAIAITNNGRELLIQFPDFNNANNPVTIAYAPGTVMGEVIAMDADSLSINLTGLVPSYIPSPVPVTIENIIDWLGVD